MKFGSAQWLALVVVASGCGPGIASNIDELARGEASLAIGTVSAPIYSDALAPGWADWSWASRNVSNTSPVAEGSKSISARFNPWTGLYLHHNGFNTTGQSYLVMMVHGGSAYDGANFMVVPEVNGKLGTGVALGPSCDGGKIRANAWVSCRIALSSLGMNGRLVNGFVVQENAGRTFASSMYFDAAGFGNGSVSEPAVDAGTPAPAVDAGAPMPPVDAGSPPVIVDAGTPGGGIVEPGSPGSADVTFAIRTDTSRRARSSRFSTRACMNT